MNEHLTMRDIATALGYAIIASALVLANIGIAFIAMLMWSIIL